MRILVTNDDGIHSPGLLVAEKIARTISDDVWVVAPESEQSGASHSLTLSLPLRLRRAGDHKFALSGTPTDCVLMAIAEVLKDRKPDLVLSGVNRGSNIADDVTYSGTIAGAMEGTTLGVRSIALSQSFTYAEGRSILWGCAEAHGPDVVRRLIETGWPEPEDVLMNVNFPDCEPQEVTGVEVTEQGKRDQQEAFVERRTDMRRNSYYWIGFKRVRSIPSKGSDLCAIYEKRISITPLHLDLTEYKVLRRLKGSLDAKFPVSRKRTRGDEAELQPQDAGKTETARQQTGPGER
ncbi:MAG: 5'/3'-nucleotidase SurE [Alphaproteobacteria bacterium]|nr:5'/3'-nucleotidase SurE [Alphaproteobacteria bacterium]